MQRDDGETFRTIQRRIRARLDERGIDMKGASIAAGLGETFVRDLLKRGRAPSPDALARLARALDTTVGYLTGETSDPADGAPAPAPPDYPVITVPEYDVRLSAGGGALIERENQSGVWQFSRAYLVDELRLRPQDLAIVEVQGDSMEPTLRTGDRVLIDHSSRNPALPGVYAIWDSSATVVKRLEKVPGADPPEVVLISDNKAHGEYRVPADLVNVIGRVVWFARRL